MPVLNIASKSDDLRARCLSNFSAYGFVIDGVKVSSVEGFLQGIKFRVGDHNREKAFRSFGAEAKQFGERAVRKFVWWKRRAISYGSDEHHQLLARAIRAKFEQNEVAMSALVATDGMILTHDLGHPELPHTSLPAALLCEILMRLRREAIRARR
ncbi:MAG: hypothetical protein Q8R25_03700 [bacterium]|nr:hypothetical protein [bacterium]